MWLRVLEWWVGGFETAVEVCWEVEVVDEDTPQSICMAFKCSFVHSLVNHQTITATVRSASVY